MFHPLIALGRDHWLKQPNCPARGLLAYMRRRGGLRPVQIDALATYLFLKLHCGNAPLWRIFMGRLWEPPWPRTEVGWHAREAYMNGLRENPATASAIKLLNAAWLPEEEARKTNFKTLFYGVAYPDYLFSLPMGAGKTYLMAAMIYLNLYFAEQDPGNPTFAHNFLVLAPSGTKSSIVPSLRKIRDFDPDWVLPPEDAARLKRALAFEVLDAGASAARSTRTKNPNAQKIACHGPLNACFGLVAVVNAEKVILDRLDKTDDPTLFDKGELARIRVANELRDLLGRLPHLALLVDEAHHVPTARQNLDKAAGADASEIRLRTVIHGWAARGNVTETLGFSGTPYLDKADRFALCQRAGGTKSFSCPGMTNVVHHFPLVQGVGVFLKRPIVRTCAGAFTAAQIVEDGLRAFMARHRDTVWPDGSRAKLAIYAGTITRAEEEIAPLVRRLLSEYGLGEEALLIHHQGNKNHPVRSGSALAFARLDRPDSPIRVIILVQIGKEGWDCRSLAGVILSQEGDCNQKMVLQTTCRCLREVADADAETAVIILNDANSRLLEEQLHAQQRATLKDFQTGARPPTVVLRDRRRALGLDGVTLPFYQLRVDYSEVPEAPADPAAALAAIAPEADRFRLCRTIRKGDFRNVNEASVEVAEPTPEHASFWLWLCTIVKEGLDTLPMTELKPHRALLQTLFRRVTRPDEAGGRVYRTDLDQQEVRAAVRRAFAPHHALRASETRTLEQAVLVTGLPACVPDDAYTVPDEAARKAILDHDNAADDPAHNEETRRLIEMLRARGNVAAALALEQETGDRGLRESDRTYHLLPYHMDSSLERRFFEAVRGHHLLEKYGLTLLYNGDRAHTDFKIRCYEHHGEAWRFVGEYTPDFLFLQKKGDRIVRALIVETKGQVFAQDEGFRLRRAFMENDFVKEQGNAAPRYAYRVYDRSTDIADLDDFIERVCNDCFAKEP